MSQETLLSQTRIWLFGRILQDIIVLPTVHQTPASTFAAGNPANTPPQMGQNNFLQNQLRSDEAKLARIYAYSFEASYHDLARPAIFLVHGEGLDPEGWPQVLTPDQRVMSRMPSETGRTGLASMSGSFTDGMKAWIYDRADFTIRLDIEGGSFDTLLLCAEAGDMDMPARSAGSVVRSAGSVARSAGSVARAAGSVVRSR